MGPKLSFTSAAIIVISSAIYYADTGMKTKENFFKGFPVVWNMIVFTLFVISRVNTSPSWWWWSPAALTFVPVNFLHPVRVNACANSTCRLPPVVYLRCYRASGGHGCAPHWIRIGIAVDRHLPFLHRGGDAGLPQSRSKGRSRSKGMRRMTKAFASMAWRPGGPALRGCGGRSARPGPGALAPHRDRAQLHRHLLSHRPLPGADGLPLIPGSEAAGVVIDVGEGVDGLKPGDRVAYARPARRLLRGTPRSRRPAGQAARGISDEQAAAMMLKGMTAEYLLRRTYHVQPGDRLLFHAAAGGVGLIFGPVGQASRRHRHRHRRLARKGRRWPRRMATTTSSTTANRISWREVEGHHRRAQLCDVVYDSVGKDTFPGSLDCLRPRRHVRQLRPIVRADPALQMSLLSQKGSLFVTRPTLFHYIAERGDLEASAAELFDVVARGRRRYPDQPALRAGGGGHAHRDLEARRTTGTTVLLP